LFRISTFDIRILFADYIPHPREAATERRRYSENCKEKNKSRGRVQAFRGFVIVSD
jgi:hypothetical protein